MNIEKVIYDNQKLIYSIAKYFSGYQNKEDLYQAGYLGVINAFKNYDENKGCKFSTYAYPYILGEMKKLVREDKGIKINRQTNKINLMIEKAYIILSQTLMRTPSIKEISDYLNIDENIISDAILSTNKIRSIDETIGADNDFTLEDVIGYNDNIDELIMLKDSLLKLSKEEQAIINNRYVNDLTQTETSNIMNISQVQVSRKEKKILKKLKKEIMMC